MSLLTIYSIGIIYFITIIISDYHKYNELMNKYGISFVNMMSIVTIIIWPIIIIINTINNIIKILKGKND
jgi:hypothetical protein